MGRIRSVNSPSLGNLGSRVRASLAAGPRTPVRRLPVPAPTTAFTPNLPNLAAGTIVSGSNINSNAPITPLGNLVFSRAALIASARSGSQIFLTPASPFSPPVTASINSASPLNLGPSGSRGPIGSRLVSGCIFSMAKAAPSTGFPICSRGQPSKVLARSTQLGLGASGIGLMSSARANRASACCCSPAISACWVCAIDRICRSRLRRAADSIILLSWELIPVRALCLSLVNPVGVRLKRDLSVGNVIYLVTPGICGIICAGSPPGLVC